MSNFAQLLNEANKMGVANRTDRSPLNGVKFKTMAVRAAAISLTLALMTVLD